MDTKKIRIALGDININTQYQIRDIDSHKIAVFSDLLKMQTDFPAITLDQDNTVIDGFHRYNAMLRVYKPNKKISALQIKFKNSIDRLMYAGKSNQSHGFRLTSFEEKKLAFRLLSLGSNEEEISEAIGRPVSKIIKWGSDALIVIDPVNKTKSNEPRKGGVDEEIKSVTKKQYEKIENKYSGWTPTFHANQIILHIENKTINLKDENVVYKLKELVEVIQKVLKK